MDHKKLKEILEGNRVGQSILTVMRIWKYPDYWQWLKDRENGNVFKIQEFGDCNSDKIIYIIGDDFHSYTGFFAAWAVTCHGLMVTDRYGFTPIADWTKSPYFDEAGWNGFTNPFDYFF